MSKWLRKEKDEEQRFWSVHEKGKRHMGRTSGQWWHNRYDLIPSNLDLAHVEVEVEEDIGLFSEEAFGDSNGGHRFFGPLTKRTMCF